MVRSWFFILFYILGLCGCSTTASESNDTLIGSEAHPAVYQMDSFWIEKAAPQHEKSKTQSMPFYYKECDINSQTNYYSKTSYSCN